MARKVVGFGEDDLRALAGARSFERGLGYLDAVSGVEVGDGSVAAAVHGTDAYDVELTLGGGASVSGWCDCPYGQEGNFCKHCVAVGLTVLGQAESIPRQRAAARARASGLGTWLTALSRDELLTLVREQIGEDRELRRRLELQAAAARSDTGAVRDRILALIDPRPFARYGYVEYADAPGYARQVAEAADALRALASGGLGGQAVGLAEEAIRALGEAYGEIDDSDGVVGQAVAAVARPIWRRAMSGDRIRSGWPSGWSGTCSATGTTRRTSIRSITPTSWGLPDWPVCDSWRPRHGGAARAAGRSGI
ncbi:SWIM zinc finger family protein [Streptomyces sp. NPDC096040]|uniref:SWIM zinc finger family protein n=1 Tax=Streptomyces sp. NPDC096040 TaxID=3155541 RepID=UPI003327C09F